MEDFKANEMDETVVIENEDGTETTYNVDAVIEMNHQEYIIYSNNDEMMISRIVRNGEEEEWEEVTDEEMGQIIDAYEQALKDED
ncbi:DUF1292 domain-containing protein [Aquibacillus salsiterrae]|uniref:DUF1292 domain-containing protein n=1 Tax=Aquibacillus salsiterrae TaxID=2950439 RepID=A0A9X3WEQ9_9BACI|nr:DUF1292 domain-containing protein [Aquibacillus salsiterrae]MDC3417096.1 DUF1292 domain-containing protein [Aquibacillus salsiterrae]